MSFKPILALHAKLMADLEEIKVSEQTFRATERAIKIGLKDNESLLSTEKLVYKAKITYEYDACNALLLRAKLYQLAGKLDKAHIKEINDDLSMKMV